MIYKNILLCFFLLLIAVKASAAVFVVTSNADSGPGTLREALTLAAANGSATQDVINFNIADQSEAGRTITIVTNLPDISSNLVIDGTTQTGSVFGLSNARIKVGTPRNNNGFIIFQAQKISNIEFYGLYIYDPYDMLISRPATQSRSGLKFTNCNNIIVGAPNKGNMIRGFNGFSLDMQNSDYIKIQSNIIGLGKLNKMRNDEIPDDGDWYTGIINIYRCNHIFLGGASNEGNIIFTVTTIKFYQQTDNKITIGSNNFCVYQDGISTEWYFEYDYLVGIFGDFASGVSSAQAEATEPKLDLSIYNNTSGSQELNAFRFQLIAGIVNFTNNFFNIARDGVTDVTYHNLSMPPQSPIAISQSAAQFNIGSNNINDKNYFNNSYPPVSANDVANVFLRYNEFKCIINAPYNNYIPTYKTSYTLPKVNIGGITTNSTHTLVTGTSTPNATIDIYSSESCKSQCNIRSYTQTIIADNAGNWQADVLNLNGIFYVSATLNNQTSLFKTLEVNSDNVNIQHMRCSNLATISGLIIPTGVNYYWVDANGNIVSTDLTLNVRKAGSYHLVLGGGCINSQVFQIIDKRVTVYDGTIAKTNASCGNSTAGIKNLFVYDPLSLINTKIWTDGNGKVVGNASDLTNVPAGSYTLTVNTTDGCTTTYGPVTLTNTAGPNIDQSTTVIQGSNCGTSTGSITHVVPTGTGTLTYSWKNAQQQVVATTLDLLNQPAGKYTLQLTDQSSCGPVSSSQITIPELNGITIDESQVINTSATCSNSNGSIKNIVVTGATLYQWLDANNQLVASSNDLLNVLPGTYHLVASNSTCSKQSANYTVVNIPGSANYPSTKKLVNATCGLNNGSIEVIFTGIAPKAVRWVNAATQTVGNSLLLNNIDAGTYQLYVTDVNGCESPYLSYTISRVPVLQFDSSFGTVNDDNCNLQTGSIIGVKAIGGLPPYTYTWLNSNNTSIAKTVNLNNVSAGAYTLNITDASGCNTIGRTYTVNNQSSIIASPSVSNVQLCGPGPAIITINNPSSGYKYRLYTSADITIPAAEQSSSQFKIAVKKSTDYYISQLSGTCESPRIPVKVNIGLTAVNITNTFTPNGDGINDSWKIDGMENYPNAKVQVFNRNGQIVFESTGYHVAFNGSSAGNMLPAGMYYYIINLNSKCDIISGSLTIIK